MDDPRAEYERRIARWDAAIAVSERHHLIVSNVRLIVFALGALAVWLGARGTTSLPWDAVLVRLLAWLLVPAAAFTALVGIHARVLEGGERARRARRLYERGLARLDGRWPGSGPDGSQFLEDHPYARDLDLFGPGSLFQLLDTARTEAGQDVLAAWLKSPAPFDEVLARQQAVDEFRPLIDFRESLAVLADEAQVGQTGMLSAWARSTPVRFPRALTPALAGAALVTAALALGTYLGVIPGSLFLGWLFVEAAIALPSRRLFQAVLEAIATPERDLALLAALLERIERERMLAPRLRSLQSALAASGGASRNIARLRRLVSLLESSTHNLLFMPITSALLVPQQLAMAIARWHAASGSAVVAWLRAVGELEALSALATYGYEHPDEPFPVLNPRGPVFDATALAHPLLPSATAVANDVTLGGAGPRVVIVSGSNMSGKSTLMRAVGVNAVLAMAGAPVRARRLELSPLAVGATIRIEDSLQQGHSRFYTEILRIREIVALARGQLPVLFLLDEILHGTNSYDRRLGAEAIVRSLVDAGAIGLVTTHDLALTELPNKLGSRAANAHFEDRIENGAIVFDYRMRNGVVEHSNALALMRAIGLDV